MRLGSCEVDRVWSFQKIPTRLHGTNFCTTSAHFARSFVRQPNSPKCSQIVQITPKYEFRIQWGGSSVFIVKNSDVISWHELLDRFALSVVTQPNCPKCIQVVQNAPKHEVRVQWGGLRAFVSENSDTTSWHKLLHHFGMFCTEFGKAN